MKICADAGGTNIRFAYVDDTHHVLLKKKYPISFFPDGRQGFLSATNRFLEETEGLTEESVHQMIVCASGHILNDAVQFTNSHWYISKQELEAHCEPFFAAPFQVKLLNDFEAIAYGLSTIESTQDDSNDVVAVYPREGFGDTQIVCGPGTGLGLAALKQIGHRAEDLVAISSEGGHQSFPVESSIERDILAFSMQDSISYEHILSGRGLQMLFKFFCKESGIPTPGERLPEQIIELHHAGNDAASQALEAFANALGSFCGNTVLALGATRGVYLWGGILKSFPEEILKHTMVRRFLNRASSTFVKDVPIYRIINGEIALRGCSVFAAATEYRN